MTTDLEQGEIFYQMVSLPVGFVGLVSHMGKIRKIALCTTREEVLADIQAHFPKAQKRWVACLQDALNQLQEYFCGQRRQFSLDLDWHVLSPFQRRVLQQLQQLPYAKRTTYGDLALQVGAPGAARAVGGVMAANPFVIVVPCHRVVGRDGRLTGYSGGAGLAVKQWLLDFELKTVNPEVATIDLFLQPASHKPFQPLTRCGNQQGKTEDVGAKTRGQ